jgi:hypothetical protein
MTRVLISTFTDPNGNESVHVYNGGSIRFARKRRDGNSMEVAKRAARNAFNDAPFGAKLVWWDGDLKRKRTVATKE